MEDIFKKLRPNAWQNMKKVRDNLINREFVNEVIVEVLKWHKEPTESRVNHLDYFRDIFNKNGLIRVQAYVLVSIITDALYDQGFTEIELFDSFFDDLRSRITGDCADDYVLKFPDDPKNINVRWYAYDREWQNNMTWEGR